MVCDTPHFTSLFYSMLVGRDKVGRREGLVHAKSKYRT
jgi:hypothetical protein